MPADREVQFGLALHQHVPVVGGRRIDHGGHPLDGQIRRTDAILSHGIGIPLRPRAGRDRKLRAAHLSRPCFCRD